MKEVYNKELGITELHPETPLEAFMDLKEFIIASWPVTREELETHFRICEKQIKWMEKHGNKKKTKIHTKC